MSNWATVCERVREACKKAGRSENDVQIIAVSKTVPIDRIEAAYHEGARYFGENYVQEALPKITALQSRCPEAKWHFIGSLQSNKAKQVVGKFDLVHSVDRGSLAQALDKEGKKAGNTLKVLLEINIASEPSKGGVKPDELISFARQVSEETTLEVKGLMSFPPLTENPETSRAYFRKTRELAEQVSKLQIPRIEMKELSMGITSDFEVAIEEGATLVRIGTAIFGSRD